ncbi:MAG: YkgJ family cysteine cluster protein [Acidobacteria bacterium]|nr:YkgJ family cysteine cluster protein [Acidobacteriota bacterium]
MTENNANPESIIRDYPRLGPDDRFAFRCCQSLECFTSCCRDVSIVLTPYDIIRMKRALEIDSSSFLDKYTISPFTRDQKIPAVLLKMDPQTKSCPFVSSEKGCRIYANRPWACRMYPLGMAEPDNPTPEDRRFYFLLKEDNCLGHREGRSITVAEWIADQGIEEYEAYGAPFKELMLHPFWNGGETLQPEQIDMYHMACYDLDRFRRFVFETSFLRLFDIDEARIEAMRTDDLELSDFAMQWLKFSLFKEKSMKINRSVMESKLGTDAETGQRNDG